MKEEQEFSLGKCYVFEGLLETKPTSHFVV
jgi:hypothetical protein